MSPTRQGPGGPAAVDPDPLHRPRDGGVPLLQGVRRQPGPRLQRGMSPDAGPAPAEERWVEEPPKRPGRTAYERDRARVLHSSALRRLAAKTQVVVPGESDFPRTRLTHSLECAQIGRELGKALGADPDLVETACLAHDLGHPPFGHTGEAALDEVAQAAGGFEGNAQSLRILTRLEAKSVLPGRAQRRAQPDPGGAGRREQVPVAAAGGQPEVRRVRRRPRRVRAGSGRARRTVARCLEAQVMDWSDDIAYSVHDLEDALVAGHLRLDVLRDPGERGQLMTLTAARVAGRRGGRGRGGAGPAAGAAVLALGVRRQPPQPRRAEERHQPADRPVLPGRRARHPRAVRRPAAAPLRRRPRRAPGGPARGRGAQGGGRPLRDVPRRGGPPVRRPARSWCTSWSTPCSRGAPGGLEPLLRERLRGRPRRRRPAARRPRPGGLS